MATILYFRMNFFRKTLSKEYFLAFLFIVTAIGLLNYLSSGFNSATESFIAMSIKSRISIMGYSHGLPIIKELSPPYKKNIILFIPLRAAQYIRTDDSLFKIQNTNRLLVIRDSGRLCVITRWGSFQEVDSSQLIDRNVLTR